MLITVSAPFIKLRLEPTLLVRFKQKKQKVKFELNFWLSQHCYSDQGLKGTIVNQT